MRRGGAEGGDQSFGYTASILLLRSVFALAPPTFTVHSRPKKKKIGLIFLGPLVFP